MVFLLESARTHTKATVAGVVGNVVGTSSGMTIPRIAFHFVETKWYTADDFIARIAARIPAPALSYTANAERKLREGAMSTMITMSGKLDKLRRVQKIEFENKKRFWRKVRKVLRETGRLSPPQIKEVRRKVKKLLHARNMKEWRDNFGLVQRGKVGCDNIDALLPYRPEVMKSLPNEYMSFIPPMDVRTMPPHLLARLQQVESKLDIVLRIRGGAAAYVPDKRDSNRGMSLGRTTVSGGRHSNADDEVSGSIHMNRNLTGLSRRVSNECTAQGVDLERLQKEVVSVVCDIVEECYGKAPWYKAAMDKIRNIPPLRLLPGARIPASHIWWTMNPRSYHVHTDTNTIPPAFLLCATRVKGGELCCLPSSGGVRVVDTTPGTVVGGSWAQYPHCNAPVLEGERHSFVVYLDNRNVSSKYNVLIDE